MPPRFEILRPLEEDTASKLLLVRDNKRGGELRLRRFKTQIPEELEGLQELFRQLATVQNSHLDRLIDFGADKDGFYSIVAGPLPGETLSQVLQRGPLTVQEFETVALQLLDVLSVLHEAAIVHGSLRPDCVRITGGSAAEWQVTLHGFGQGFAGRNDSKEEQIRAYRCTAPEQWQDGTTRRRTDVYALGCVLYEALTARPPFDARALKELRGKHLGHDLTPLQKLASHVPAWMCAWVMHLLAADPEQRPRKAAAARELFERREAPTLPEQAPARVESSPVTPPPAPPVLLVQPQASAPVVLPSSKPGARNATSSTIPIATGPHVAANRPKRPSSAVAAAPRKTYAPPRKSTPAETAAKNLKPMLIAGAAILLLLVVFLVPRCGQKPVPVKASPAKRSATNGKPGQKKH